MGQERDGAIERWRNEVDPVSVEVEGAATRLIDAELGTWVLEAVPLDMAPGNALPVSAGMAASLVGSLAEAFPQFAEFLSSGSGIVVRFSPEVERGLRQGTYQLVQSGGVAKAVARSATTGQVVESESGVHANGATPSPAA